MRTSVAAAAVLAAGMVILRCWLLTKLAGSVVVEAVLARSRTTAPVTKFCPDNVTGIAWFKASKVAGALL